MRIIRKLVNELNDEINSAKNYAEKYIESKAKNDTMWSNRYSEMAEDELRHAIYIHELIEKEIEDIRMTFTPPQDMMDKWEKAHKKYIEKVSIIKQLLAM